MKLKAQNLKIHNIFLILFVSIGAILLSACDAKKPDEPASGWGNDARAPKPAEVITTSKTAIPQIAGEIFDTPIPLDNYLFAKRVHTTFKEPADEKLTSEQMEQKIFENLIYSYEAFRRNIQVTNEEMDQWIDSVLAALDLKFKRKEDPAAYASWATDKLKESVEMFENQMKYMAQIEKLKREMIKEMKAEATEQEMEEDFMNVQNHVGGEYTLFETKDEAQAFYDQYHDQKTWEKMKKDKPELIKPFSLITLQAIIDLWGVPKEQIKEFHEMKLGEVGKPLPFGSKWGVFRLLDKRTGDLKDFDENKKKESKARVESRKKVEARDQWLKDLIKNANLKILVKPEMFEAPKPSEAPKETKS